MMTINSIVKRLVILCMSYLLFGCSQTHFYEDIYHASLCAESGVFINKTVNGVTSVFQMRYPEKRDEVKRKPLYLKAKWTGEKPYWDFSGDSWTGNYPNNFGIFIPQNKFEIQALQPITNYFFEGVAKPSPNGEPNFVRITSEFVLTSPCSSMYCYAQTEQLLNISSVDAIESRYGFTWEQITPKYFSDRIVGAEWKVIDLKTGEILAYARDYVLFPRYYCLSSHGCSNDGGSCLKPKLINGSWTAFNARDFVSSVLKPTTTVRKKLYEETTK